MVTPRSLYITIYSSILMLVVFLFSYNIVFGATVWTNYGVGCSSTSFNDSSAKGQLITQPFYATSTFEFQSVTLPVLIEDTGGAGGEVIMTVWKYATSGEDLVLLYATSRNFVDVPSSGGGGVYDAEFGFTLPVELSAGQWYAFVVWPTENFFDRNLIANGQNCSWTLFERGDWYEIVGTDITLAENDAAMLGMTLDDSWTFSDELPDTYLEIFVTSYDADTDTFVENVCTANSLDDNGYNGDYRAICPLASTTNGISVIVQATSTLENWKTEWYFKDSDGAYKWPEWYFSGQTLYGGPGFYTTSFLVYDTEYFLWDLEEIHLIDVCAGDALSSSQVDTDFECVNMYIGLFATTSEMVTKLNALGLIADGTVGTGRQTQHDLYGCDDISAFAVGEQVRCVLIDLFVPSEVATDVYRRARDDLLHKWPYGYLMYLVEAFNDRTATSTSFGVTTDVSAFGITGSSTFINLSAAAGGAEELSPALFDIIDTILWAMFWLFLAYRVMYGAFPGLAQTEERVSGRTRRNQRLENIDQRTRQLQAKYNRV